MLGVLQLVNKKGGGEGAGRAFGAEDEALLAAIATHLSNALTNAVLYRDALDATRHSEAVLTLPLPPFALPRSPIHHDRNRMGHFLMHVFMLI